MNLIIDFHESVENFIVNFDTNDDSFDTTFGETQTIGNPNAVLYVPQELTEEQKAQARANIGVGDGQDKTFVYEQSSASTTWNIQHNLNKFPSVSIIDSAGSSVIGEINYESIDSLVLSFTAPFSGYAYLN